VTSAPAHPRVEAVILNWNGVDDTLRCLEALRRLDYPELGVVVVDNGSLDDSVERLSVLMDAGGLDARLIPVGENLGFAGGVNRGLERVLEDGAAYAWILNNDAVPDLDALTRLVERAEADPRCALVGSTVVSLDGWYLQAAGGGRYSRWTGRALRHGEGMVFDPDRLPAGPLDFVYGASVLARVEAVHEIGPMDEAFFVYSEEVDWALRALKAGWRLAYAPDSVVRHAEGASTDEARPFRDYHGVRGQLLLIRKHHPWRLPVALAYSAYRHVAPKVARGEWDRLWAVLRAYRSLWSASADGGRG